MEIKNELTATRGDGGGGKQGKQGKGNQGTCIKDTWTKPKGVRIKGGRWRWVGQKLVVGGGCRQLYLNNNKNK